MYVLNLRHSMLIIKIITDDFKIMVFFFNYLIININNGLF